MNEPTPLTSRVKPPAEDAAAVFARMKPTVRATADVVRDKIADALPPASGVIVTYQRAVRDPAGENSPAYYSLMGPLELDHNHVMEMLHTKYGDSINRLGSAYDGEHVERWSVSKPLFSEALPRAIKSEQKFASLSTQIMGNIRDKSRFPQMEKAQFSGEIGTHYIIDGIATSINGHEHRLSPTELFPDKRVEDPAHFKAELFWRFKVPVEDMHAALGVEVPAVAIAAK